MICDLHNIPIDKCECFYKVVPVFGGKLLMRLDKNTLSWIVV